MIVLGIETSCDETAAAVVSDDRRIVAQRILSQLDEHRPYGGIVPEIAARSHLDHLDRLIAETMAEAGLGFGELDGVAATAGPGLIGGVMVGLMTGKSVAVVHDLPFAAINHLEGHALTVRLTGDVPFPYLLLLVSGGHCQFLVVDGVGRYRRLGTTIDDAVGEAFDKVAKMIGLGFPGGPLIERAAEAGDPDRFALPRPMTGRPGCNLSFSGLKTAVHHAIGTLPAGALGRRDVADIAASFQAAVVDTLAERSVNAIAAFRDAVPDGRLLVVAGGVAANRAVRARLENVAVAHGLRLLAPAPQLCTDNAAMVAWAGIERLRLGLRDGFDARARPRWPLEEVAGAATGA
jgi:N6-L-threonylcarbamoyladenine synthase